MASFFPDFHLDFYFSRPVWTFISAFSALDFYLPFSTNRDLIFQDFVAAMALLLNAMRTYERTTVHRTNEYLRAYNSTPYECNVWISYRGRYYCFFMNAFKKKN